MLSQALSHRRPRMDCDRCLQETKLGAPGVVVEMRIFLIFEKHLELAIKSQYSLMFCFGLNYGGNSNSNRSAVICWNSSQCIHPAP